MKPILAPLLLLAMTGCVSMGTNYDPAQIQDLAAGMSEAEVIERLGKPNAVSFKANGEHVAVWSFSKGNAFGGARARAAALLFDAENRFVRVLSVSETEAR